MYNEIMTTNNLRIGIAVSSFNPEITENLLAGVLHAFNTKYIEIVTAWGEKNDDRVWGREKRNAAAQNAPKELAEMNLSQGQHNEKEAIKEAANKFVGFKRSLITEVIRVPGSFELPLAAQWLASGKTDKGVSKEGATGVDAVVALGALIKGDTPHFAYISSAVSQGLMDVGIKYNIPVGFGVITADTLEQARQRADLGFMQSSQQNKQQEGETVKSNKGYEAAVAVLEMLLAKEVRVELEKKRKEDEKKV